MGGLSDALAAVVARFRGVTVGTAALRVFSDPTDVTPPCVFVPLPDIEFRFSKRCLDLTWTAYVVGPNSPTARGTAENIAIMLDAIAGLYPFTSGDLYSLTLPGGGPPAQAYRLQWLDKIPMGGDDDGE